MPARRPILMGHEQITAWLNLPAGPWPPDHYTLLGLPQGEEDRARVERHVQERLERVRQFQLAHPEPATEAMNRLAQAFVCLTDPQLKRAYDVSLLAPKPGPAAAAQLDWRQQPPPQRAPAADGAAAGGEAPTLQDAATAEAAAVEPAGPEPAAAAWEPPRRGLATRRALLERTLLLRRLLAAWRGAGTYLSRSTRPLTRPAEATDLLQLMERVRALLQVLPGLLGEAGQPGYLVAALARQPLIVPTVQTLLPSQRAALARDWQSGLDRLTAYHHFLREEVRAHRRRGGLARWVRAVLVTLRDRPGLILFALGLVALNLVPKFQRLWREQAVLLLGLLAFYLFLWWDARDSARRARAAGRRPRTFGGSSRASRSVR